MLFPRSILMPLLPTLLVIAEAAAAEPAGKASVKDSLTRDYASELPRISPTEPADAAATVQILPGFRQHRSPTRADVQGPPKKIATFWLEIGPPVVVGRKRVESPGTRVDRPGTRKESSVERQGRVASS